MAQHGVVAGGRKWVPRLLIDGRAGGYMPPPAAPGIARQGAIAQLGERLNGIQEVSGSIPLGSTSGGRERGGILARMLPNRMWSRTHLPAVLDGVIIAPAEMSRLCSQVSLLGYGKNGYLGERSTTG